MVIALAFEFTDRKHDRLIFLMKGFNIGLTRARKLDALITSSTPYDNQNNRLFRAILKEPSLWDFDVKTRTITLFSRTTKLFTYGTI